MSGSTTSHPKPDRAHGREIVGACASMHTEQPVSAEQQIVIAVRMPVMQPVMLS